MVKDRKEPKIVAQLPIQELWAGQRLISTIKIRDLTLDNIVSLLRINDIRLAVADVGKELWWVPNNKKYEVWKNEIKPHLAVQENRNSLDDFPGSYFYIASEWRSYSGATIVLLEKHH